jgi:uncharacterized membrane protein
VLGTVASALLTSVVFVCSSLLVAVQLVSAQLTPRIINVVFRDSVTKLSLTLFGFMFTFFLASLLRIASIVPLLTAHLAVYGSLVALAVFFFLMDQSGKTCVFPAENRGLLQWKPYNLSRPNGLRQVFTLL